MSGMPKKEVKSNLNYEKRHVMKNNSNFLNHLTLIKKFTKILFE